MVDENQAVAVVDGEEAVVAAEAEGGGMLNKILGWLEL